LTLSFKYFILNLFRSK